MKKAVMCIAQTRNSAESIVSQLQSAGFANSDISVLFPNKDGTKVFAHEHNTKAPEGAVAGAGTGGVLGGALGVLVGIGALAIPGLGPFIAAGPILAALSGVAAGAAVGGVAGHLAGHGVAGAAVGCALSACGGGGGCDASAARSASARTPKRIRYRGQARPQERRSI